MQKTPLYASVKPSQDGGGSSRAGTVSAQADNRVISSRFFSKKAADLTCKKFFPAQFLHEVFPCE
ncbi:hypothetical protein OH491_11695 [Termitidicoccus mucosus]|uniref:hypothetical protein n=1 Tax=Termitidicoccus mucosus TaxID=1184151 RepID=UPI0011AB8D86